MKIALVITFLLTLILASCAGVSDQKRDVASDCQKGPSTEYHSYFEDYEKCKGW